MHTLFFGRSREIKWVLRAPCSRPCTGLHQDIGRGNLLVHHEGCRQGCWLHEVRGHPKGWGIVPGLIPRDLELHLRREAENFVVEYHFLREIGLGQDLHHSLGVSGAALGVMSQGVTGHGGVGGEGEGLCQNGGKL